MGFIPLPLGVVILHVLRLVVSIQGVPEYVLLALGYFCLVTARILNNILILGKACNYIEQHQKVSRDFGTNASISRCTLTDLFERRDVLKILHTRNAVNTNMLNSNANLKRLRYSLETRRNHYR